jgi:hypothetical protein
MDSNNLPMPIVVGVDYATPSEVARLRHHPLPAILLCTPGLLCWTLLAGMMVHALPLMVIRFVAGGVILPLTLAAVLTALSSVVYYFFLSRRQMPWFVILNLVINIAGLLLLTGVFTLGFLFTAW